MEESTSDPKQIGEVGPAVILMVLIAIGLFLSILVGEGYKVPATERLVEQWANKLDKMKEKSGTYIHWETAPILPENDSWGNPLQVHYQHANEDVETLEVVSAGPDKRFNTEDDIKKSQFTGLARTVKRLASEGIQQTGKLLTKGAIEAVKEEVQSLKSKKDQTPAKKE